MVFKSQIWMFLKNKLIFLFLKDDLDSFANALEDQTFSLFGTSMTKNKNPKPKGLTNRRRQLADVQYAHFNRDRIVSNI
jgi:hypothetical protein